MHEDIYVFSQYIRPENPLNIHLAGISYCDDSYCICRPDYDHFVIEYTLDGEGVLETGGNAYHLHAGDAYFLYKGRGHRYYCTGGSWTKIWIVVDGPLADALFGIYLCHRPDVIHAPGIKREMEKMLSLVKDRTLSYAEMTERTGILLHSVLIAASRHPLSEEKSLPEMIKGYIDSHLERPLSLQELSEKLHYSKNHIINVFRSAYSVTPHMYYETQKIRIACELLTGTTETVSGISARVGMDSPQYFTKCFKRHTGVTPTKYRSRSR